ncbi:MAG: hypothetical protein KIS61_24920 [Candidatus Eremiobacteraeota bacterium]|nr:hypothetical protein [Candidatus Eremiobacteraeota bacterium]
MPSNGEKTHTERVVHAVTVTAEGVNRDLTNLTKNVIVNAIQGFQDITGSVAQAALDNTRGGVQGAAIVGQDLGDLGKKAALGSIAGASEVGNQLGLAIKSAAIGFIHGSADVGNELGKVCKTGAINAIKGSGEVCAELGHVTKENLLGTIEGGTEAASSMERFLTVAARAVMRGVAEFKTSKPPAGEPARPQVPTASLDDMPPVVAEKRTQSKP